MANPPPVLHLGIGSVASAQAQQIGIVTLGSVWNSSTPGFGHGNSAAPEDWTKESQKSNLSCSGEHERWEKIWEEG